MRDGPLAELHKATRPELRSLAHMTFEQRCVIWFPECGDNDAWSSQAVRAADTAEILGNTHRLYGENRPGLNKRRLSWIWRIYTVYTKDPRSIY